MQSSPLLVISQAHTDGEITFIKPWALRHALESAKLVHNGSLRGQQLAHE